MLKRLQNWWNAADHQAGWVVQSAQGEESAGPNDPERTADQVKKMQALAIKRKQGQKQ